MTTEITTRQTEAARVVSHGISGLPKTSGETVVRAAQAGQDRKLSSKELNLTCARINKEAGWEVIRPQDILPTRNGQPEKPTFRGCLDPSDGGSVGDLLNKVAERLGQRG